MMKCAKLQIGKRSHLNVRKGVENVAANDKANKNDSSSRDCQGQLAAGHSTPVTRKPRANADDSPDLDYSPSPILPPCTQEGGNEVAWDWQSSPSRSPESRSRKRRVECETPKGTKLLQRKRNSNSPLLYKPCKRKTIIKMENIQKIGQFSAELQALIEKMRVIKENDKDRSSDCVVEKEETTSTSLKTDTSGGEKPSELKGDKRNRSAGEGSNERDGSVEETNDNVDKKEASGSYDDLFDDYVDEDMIRCTQEIEEKFSLMDKGNSAHLQVKEKEPEVPATDKTSVQSGSSEDFKNSLIRNVSGTGNGGNTLKTYSRLSLKRDMNSSINVATPRCKNSHKPCPNNNTIHSPHIQVKKPCENKKLPKNNTVELFDFLDDSFDDWFAACDDKLFPEFNGSSAREDDGTAKLQTSYKSLTNAPLKSTEANKSTEPAAAKPETSNVFANRKFFKTKSLSEQSVNQGASTVAKGRINSSYYMAKPMHPNSSRGTHTSVARAPVSTKPIVVTNECKVESNAISLMHDVGQTRESDVNRCAVKSDANRFVKHHSTDSTINKRKGQEMTKTGSQPTWCTAEEIERKRLQALARLEAKRKLFSTKVKNNINR